MLTMLKKLFAVKPGEGMMPIPDTHEKSWEYIGDGMMEEVVRPKTKQVNASSSSSYNHSYVSSWPGDSGSSYSDCGSSSGSCE
ncbi:hypothetical protein KNT93_gp170 [Escherichia phage SF]|uniref:Uncharacterized protein n=2 Tax=Mosigvirus TaxID=1913652 RepID=A0A2Z4QCZ5_9CAUD|nr:hypothetical protein KNT93_gp170 [Escherichia phage SF]ANZ51275.1 hypothetical protein [Enterobacteria phage ATK48]AWM11890.1 hypothetical protein vBEcoMNBG1_023 [Escherichia phage vB_EcoM_NBG1]AWY07973.1 hypothetical protein [Escherichia phage SF]WBF80749.1 hypothetical protein F31_0023 [Escherichia phage vB_Eco_F31]